ncbi:multisubunit sodium/proton antiporter, MrpC subunit [Geodermatophilus pulveris]|uniref:Multisubunit sodium/proton antiporter, MrpC subunit n=1 Tax=Geodermatophilus pulveris TaxID=1564159 RepID=A0A239G7L3_9ACTN|nr:Na(+)/H(+) antiporter subunit C [Geodermatophilus pulveris]SNS64965.1 multisubunit sodium/proton antiporter, MrpC subunit [Geodermatophilus pulveris]
MTPTVVLPLVIGGLYAAGVYLLLDRSLTRVVLGFLLMGNATNLLVLSAAGPAGGPPIIGVTEPEDMSDPLPQALVLTAIVITFGIASFLLAIIHRSWRLVRQEVVGVDEEDRRVARREGVHADELDPDDLAPEDRPAAHADSLHRTARAGDSTAEEALARRYAGIPSDDIDLPPTRGASR